MPTQSGTIELNRGTFWQAKGALGDTCMKQRNTHRHQWALATRAQGCDIWERKKHGCIPLCILFEKRFSEKYK